MIIFQYMFYLMSKPYKAGLDEKNPEIWACGIVTLFQSFNFISILGLFFGISFSKLLWIVIVLSILSINAIFLFNPN